MIMKNAILVGLFCCWILNAVFGILPPHEFHVSKCQIEYFEKENSIGISVHIYIDDFEEALGKKGAKNLFLCTEKENPEAEQNIENYLKEKIAILLDDKPVSFKFIGKEPSEDQLAVWCYLEIEQVNSFSKCTVTNSILMETFDDQKNIVSIKGPKARKAYFMFEQDQVTESVVF